MTTINPLDLHSRTPCEGCWVGGRFGGCVVSYWACCCGAGRDIDGAWMRCSSSHLLVNPPSRLFKTSSGTPNFSVFILLRIGRRNSSSSCRDYNSREHTCNPSPGACNYSNTNDRSGKSPPLPACPSSNSKIERKWVDRRLNHEIQNENSACSEYEYSASRQDRRPCLYSVYIRLFTDHEEADHKEEVIPSRKRLWQKRVNLNEIDA